MIKKTYHCNLCGASSDNGKIIGLEMEDDRTLIQELPMEDTEVHICSHCIRELIKIDPMGVINREVPNLTKPKTTHSEMDDGVIHIEQDIRKGVYKGGVGIQIDHESQRMWICIDGATLVRYKKKDLEDRKELRRYNDVT